MKPLKWPTNADQHQYMLMRQQQNKDRNIPAENWMWEKLKHTGLKWSRQSQWGYRIFDFWCASLGVAIEVDGKTHNPQVDAYRDRYNYERSGVIVLRVENFSEAQALDALSKVKSCEPWASRRERMGLNDKKKAKLVRKEWERR